MASWVMERSHYPEEHDVYGQHAPLLLDDHEPKTPLFYFGTLGINPHARGLGGLTRTERPLQNGVITNTQSRSTYASIRT